jgi:hypothetical protein
VARREDPVLRRAQAAERPALRSRSTRTTRSSMITTSSCTRRGSRRRRPHATPS